MSAPKGENTEIPQEEAIERALELPAEFDADEGDSVSLRESDRELHSVVYTGGDTEYAHIYLAFVTGRYRGNDMLWIRYIWLSKPGAFESDMWGNNGMSMRMVPGMAGAVIKGMLAACNTLKSGGSRGDTPPRYVDARDEVPDDDD